MRTVIAIILSIVAFNCQAQNATEIVRKMDDKMRGKSSQAELAIKTVRPNWSREMLVKTWMKEGHYAMILIQAPAKEKGIVYLKRKKEVWNWIPALERSIKLPPSMMTNSWMGTDFTNDDLVKESSAVDDYNHKIIKDTFIDKRDCYIIEFLPKTNTAVVWGKILVAIDKKDFIELYSEFYDEEGKLINVMIAHDIRMMDGRLIPTHIEMIPVDKKGQKTEIFYKTILFNRNIEDNFFTMERMKQLN
ncbi:MAG TPA: outer membrane lipoprotein-sorting protein [Sediminibacterium sp.]|nr:outer membrane lipoprotein-sorting protein [Sediminibacterium sp.]